MNKKKIFLSTITIAAFSASTLSFSMQNVVKAGKFALSIAVGGYFGNKVYDKVKTQESKKQLLSLKDAKGKCPFVKNGSSLWYDGHKIDCCKCCDLGENKDKFALVSYDVAKDGKSEKVVALISVESGKIIFDGCYDAKVLKFGFVDNGRIVSIFNKSSLLERLKNGSSSTELELVHTEKGKMLYSHDSRGYNGGTFSKYNSRGCIKKIEFTCDGECFLGMSDGSEKVIDLREREKDFSNEI